MSQTTIDPRSLRAPPRRPIRLSWSDERVRAIVWQILVVGFLGAIVWWLWSNTVHNLEVRRIATGFGATVRAAEAPVREDLRRFGPPHGVETSRTIRVDDDEEKGDQRRRPRTQ